MNVNELLRPMNEEERSLDVVEMLVLSIQVALQNAMTRGGVSQKELADRLGVSPARVSQILSESGANLTVKTIGKIAHALGEEFELVTRKQLRDISTIKEEVQFTRLRIASSAKRADPWEERVANVNRSPQKMAA